MKTINSFIHRARAVLLCLALSSLASTLYAMPACLSGSVPPAPADSASVIANYDAKRNIQYSFWFENCPATSSYFFDAILVADITLNMGDSINFAQIPEALAFRQNGIVVNGAWGSYQLAGSLIGGNGQVRTRIAQSASQYFDPSKPVDVLNRATGALVVTIPASKTAATFALSPTDNLTGSWWNSSESGWGLDINQQGDVIFGSMFTYDTDGKSMWLVLSGGNKQANGTTFTGDLFRTRGPAFNASPFKSIDAANFTKVGTMTIAFSSKSSALLTYSVNGTTIVKPIQPNLFATPATVCSQGAAVSRASLTNYTDLWWNPNESGWGLNLSHQGGIIFGSLFTYDVDGKSMWLVLSSGVKQADGSYSGETVRTTGSAFNAPTFVALNSSNITIVGTMALKFTDGENAILTYTYNGITVIKQIQRLVFGTAVPICKAVN